MKQVYHDHCWDCVTGRLNQLALPYSSFLSIFDILAFLIMTELNVIYIFMVKTHADIQFLHVCVHHCKYSLI